MADVVIILSHLITFQNFRKMYTKIDKISKIYNND